MDAIDFRLLTALHQDARQSFRALGRRVGLSAPSVRERLERLTQRGILQGYWVRPDAAIFGRDDFLLLFRGAWSRSEVVRALGAPDVAWIAWKIDGGLTVGLWSSHRGEVTEALSQLLGTRPEAEILAPQPPRTPFSLIDWKIAEGLVDDPRVELRTLCQRTHLSPKTVRKHLGRMVDDGALSIAPKLGALSESGDLLFTISVFGPIEFEEVRQILGEAALLRETSMPRAQFILGLSHSLGDVALATNRLAAHPGVTRSFVSLNRELFVQATLLRELIRREIGKIEAARRGATASASPPRP